MTQRIVFKRRRPGSYYTNSGADILDPGYMSATIDRDTETGYWVLHLHTVDQPGIYGTTLDHLSEARRVGALVLAERDQLARVNQRSRNPGNRAWDVKYLIERLVREAAAVVHREVMTELTADLDPETRARIAPDLYDSTGQPTAIPCVEIGNPTR